MLLNDKLKPYRLLLASQSPRRRELMTGCGLPYELAEKFDARRPIPTTFRLSAFGVPLDAQKRSLSGSVLENDILLTADTVVLAGGEFRMTAEGTHGTEGRFWANPAT